MNHSKLLLDKLTSLKIDYTILSHEAVSTAEAHAEAMKKTDMENFSLCKNLFVSNKKTKNRILFVLKSDAKLSFKQLGAAINVNSNHLRLANDDILEQTLKVSRGSVTPLAVMFAEEKAVEVFIDENLRKEGRLIGVHPMNNKQTVFLRFEDLARFLARCDSAPKVVSFGELPKTPSKPNGRRPQKAAPKKERDEKGLSCTRKENFAQWYSELVTKSEMIDYYNVSGCYILRPNSCFIWNSIRRFFDEKMAEFGVQEAYFPMLVSASALEAEASHIEGFQPEVAWVTRSGGKELSVPLAIRPTSETAMYPVFKNWIRSHRDLPLKLNQWANVVRWEFSNPTPFIRTREFLWQEGHTAHATAAEAAREVAQILDLYASVYEHLLAVPVIKGRKTELEKFPGADYTMTIETFVEGTGRSIQCATSHGLGQNFGKIFGIEFEDEFCKKRIPFQNSWGLTTRSIGAMLMVHGDDKGPVVPPRVARFQIVVVPITKSFGGEEKALFREGYMNVVHLLEKAGVRTHVDERLNYKPGWKYNFWELQGVPLRVEFGQRELDSATCVLVRRDNGKKCTVELASVARKAKGLMEEIQRDMLEKARLSLEEHREQVTEWGHFLQCLDRCCYVEAPFCNRSECEKAIKERTKGDEEIKPTAEGSEKTGLSGAAKSLCIPIVQKVLDDGTKCFACDSIAKNWTLFGRSY